MNHILILLGILVYFITRILPYRVILGPEARYAPHDAIPALLDQLGCTFFLDADVIVTDYEVYPDYYEIFTFKQLYRPNDPYFVFTAKYRQIATAVFLTSEFDQFMRKRWDLVRVITDATGLKRPIAVAPSLIWSFKCPDLKTFENKSVEVNYKTMRYDLKYYALKHRNNVTCFDYYLSTFSTDFSFLAAVDMNVPCVDQKTDPGSLGQFDHRLRRAIAKVNYNHYQPFAY